MTDDLLDKLRDAVIASAAANPAELTILLSKACDYVQHLELMLDWGKDGGIHIPGGLDLDGLSVPRDHGKHETEEPHA